MPKSGVWIAEDRLFFQQVTTRALGIEEIRRTAEANPFDKFSLGIRPRIKKLMLARIAENGELVTRYLNEPEFEEIAFDALAREIFEAAAAT